MLLALSCICTFHHAASHCNLGYLLLRLALDQNRPIHWVWFQRQSVRKHRFSDLGHVAPSSRTKLVDCTVSPDHAIRYRIQIGIADKRECKLHHALGGWRRNVSHTC